MRLRSPALPPSPPDRSPPRPGVLPRALRRVHGSLRVTRRCALRPRHLLGALLLIGLLVPMRPAHALFDNYGLDPAYCAQPTVRSTVVYVDDMMMTDGQSGWATTLATKLRATLTPGERVTVVRLSPATGRSAEQWSGCWPDYPPARKATLGDGTYLFQQNPVARLEDQQKYFIRDLGAALTRIYLDAKRPAAEVRVDADHPPQKQIVRALASDEGRFANSQVTIRAIIYSDMAENGDLGSAFSPSHDPPTYGQRLGSYLRRGVFYAYGVGEDVHGDPAFLEQARSFWSAALRSMAATVMGIGADLNVPNTLPLQAWSWPVTLTFDGQPLDGRLSLLTGADGNLVDSWIGISRLGSAALTGTFRCKPNAENGCRLDAETASGLATNAPSESLVLTGGAKVLTGRIGIKGQNTMFGLKTEAPNL
ncbi:MAG: hypothetical protein BGO51_12390 [Rhodospirillales bacterium 69-11]|nr:hypothetical protein [Rhodospirillales bacterium]OJW24880.1 MAG: hypothetical protein BGO51_12390 [Rhodospirillales bacterium 69-11]